MVWEFNNLQGVTVHTDVRIVVKILHVTQHPVTPDTETLAQVCCQLLFCLVFTLQEAAWICVAWAGYLTSQCLSSCIFGEDGANSALLKQRLIGSNQMMHVK